MCDTYICVFCLGGFHTHTHITVIYTCNADRLLKQHPNNRYMHKHIHTTYTVLQTCMSGFVEVLLLLTLWKVRRFPLVIADFSIYSRPSSQSPLVKPRGRSYGPSTDCPVHRQLLPGLQNWLAWKSSNPPWDYKNSGKLRQEPAEPKQDIPSIGFTSPKCRRAVWIHRAAPGPKGPLYCVSNKG